MYVLLEGAICSFPVYMFISSIEFKIPLSENMKLHERIFSFREPEFDLTRPDTRHKMRLVCVLCELFTFENNTGHTDGPTDGPTDGHDLL